MKNISTYLLEIVMFMFWCLRIAVAFNAELGGDFAGLEPFNKQIEIALLFIVLVCIILVAKRKLLGAIIYLLSYGLYFGADVTKIISAILNPEDTQVIGMGNYFNLLISFIGVILPLAVLFDLLLDKGRKANPRDKKTDWFYKNEEYDRKLDERADKNNYRTL